MSVVHNISFAVPYGPSLISRSERSNSIQILYKLAEELSLSPMSSRGFFDGDAGLCLFLFSCSEFLKDKKFARSAFSRIDEKFSSLRELSLMGLKSNYSVKSGLLGIDLGLTLFNEYNFIEVDTDIFSTLDKIIKPWLSVDNLLDFSISTGVCGIGLYIINKLDMASRYDLGSRAENIRLLMKILSYSELSFKYSLKTGFESYIDDIQILNDKIEYTYIPLLCEGRFLFSDVEFRERLTIVSSQLLDFYKSKTDFKYNEVYERILVANSLYIASTYLEDSQLKKEALKIIENVFGGKSEYLVGNISLGKGLAGIMYTCFRLCEFENLSWLADEIKRMFENILENLEEHIQSGTIKDLDHTLSVGISGIALSISSIVFRKRYNWDFLLGLGRPHIISPTCQ